MNTNERLRSLGSTVVFVVALSLCVFDSAVQAASALYWDPNGLGSSSGGGTGTWDTGSWWNGSGDVGWAAGDDAYFGGPTPGAVTIASGVSANNLFFNTSGYSVGGNTLTLTGGTVNVATASSATIGAVIAGNAGLTKAGSGLLALTGPDIYSGTTTINGGTLDINNTNATTAISLAVGGGTLGGSGSATSATATLQGNKNALIAGFGGAGSLTLGGLTFPNATVSVYVNNIGNYTSAAAINVTGNNALTAHGGSGTVKFVLSGSAPTVPETVHLLKYVGSVQGTGTNAFALNSSGVNSGVRSVFTLSATSDPGYIDLIYSVDYPIWSGAGNGIWFTSTSVAATGTTNWVLASNPATETNYVANDSVVFNDSAGAATTVSISGTGSVSPAGVTFNNNTHNYTIQGTYGIAGYAALTLNGSGAVTITNSNSYYGGTTLNAGRLNIANAAALGGPIQGSNYGTFTINGGTLDNTSGSPLTLPNYPINWNGNIVFGGSNPLNLGAGNVTLGGSNSSAAIYLSGSTLTVGGGIAGNGYGLTQNGTGLLLLTGSSSYTGPTTVNGGTLGIGNGGSGAALAGTSGVTLAATNTELIFNHSDHVTLAAPIGGSGSLIQTGLGTLTLTSASSYGGATSIAGGVLQISGSPANGGLPATTPLTISKGGVFDMTNGTQTIASLSSTDGLGSQVLLGGSGMLTIGAPTNSTFDGIISGGGGSLILQGPAAMTLTGSNTYGGSTTVSAGTLTLAGANGSVAGNITNNASLVFANLANQTYNGVISGGGSLTKLGPNTLTLANSQSYAGNTYINGGTLRLDAPRGTNLSGFGANTTGSAGSNSIWTVNTNNVGTTAISGGSLTLTDGNTSEARSAFFNTPVAVNAPFTVNFTYKPTDGPVTGTYIADGATFILQNDSRGLTALGNPGGSLGYSGATQSAPGITPSVGVGVDIYTYEDPQGVVYLSNGTISTCMATGSVNVGSLDPIAITLSYNGSNTVSVSLLDLTTSATYSSTYSVGNIAALVGGNTAYLGFTGASGAGAAIQTISNFTSNFNYSPSANNILPATTAIRISSGTLDLFGSAQTVASLSGGGTVTNTNTGSISTLTTGGDNSSQTYSGVLMDNGGYVALVKVGSGGLTLTGANMYSGGTTVAGGTLQLGNPTALGTGSLAANAGVLDLNGFSVTTPSFSGAAGTVTNSASKLATLTVSQSIPTTFSGAIMDGTGPVGLALTGSGSLFLNGANGYSGPTTVSAGILAAAAANTLSPSSAVNVSGGTLDVTAAPQTIAALAVGASGALNLSFGNLLTISGTAGFAPGSTLNIFDSINALPELLATYSGAANGAFTNIIYNGGYILDGDLSYSGGSLQLVSLAAGPASWIAPSSTWSTAANWSVNASPNGPAVLAVLNQATPAAVAITLDVPVTLGTLQLGNGGASTSYTLSGNMLTFDNSGVDAAVTVLSGTHTIAAPIVISGGNLDIAASSSSLLILSGNISDDGGLRTLTLDGDGSGQLVLSGSNSYGGGTVVNAGTLIVNSATALPDGSSLTVGLGASAIFAPQTPAAAGIVAVPEPATLLLLTAALGTAAACRRLEKRKLPRKNPPPLTTVP